MMIVFCFLLLSARGSFSQHFGHNCGIQSQMTSKEIFFKHSTPIIMVLKSPIFVFSS